MGLEPLPYREMDFGTCGVSAREILQMCLWTSCIFLKPESPLRFPETFFQAAVILRYTPYKGCVSIGHKWLISWVKTPFPNFPLKKKKQKSIKDYLRRRAIVISYGGHLSSPFISDARLGVYTVLVSWAWIVFNLLIVLKMRLTVNCQCACSFWLRLTSSWSVH